MLFDSVSTSAALFAGLLSFFSPCILPLIPGYFTFITGFSLEELEAADQTGIRAGVMVSTLSFIFGFSSVFVLLGISASFVGGLFYQYQGVLRIIGGLVVIVFGLHVLGLFRFKFLDMEKRMHLNKKPVHILGTVIVGMAFGAGWSPCIGPLLGSILAIAAGQGTVSQGVWLLSVYSLGLAIPFLLMSVFVHLVLHIVRRANRFLRYVNTVAGVLMIGIGILLIMDRLRVLG